MSTCGRQMAIVLSATLLTVLLAAANAGAVSSKYQFSLKFGREVNSTKAGGTPEAEDVCTVESGDSCRTGKLSPIAGGFAFPEAVATAPGDFVYVTDSNNNRIQEFNREGKFVRMIGAGVLTGGAEGTGTLTAGSATITSATTTKKAFVPGQAITAANGGIPAETTITAVGVNSLTLSHAATVGGAGVTLTVAAGVGSAPSNEKQTVTIAGTPTGGTFTLSFESPNPGGTSETTGAIAFNATAQGVREALEHLVNVGAGNVAVTGAPGGPYTVEFAGARYEDTNVAQMTAVSSLTGGSSPAVSVATAVEGHTASADDVCGKASDCVAGVRGTGGPAQFSVVQDVTVDPVSKNVFTYEYRSDRVEEFTEAGEFVLMIGREVNETKDRMTATPEEKNVCTAAEIENKGVKCKAGVASEKESSEPGAFKGEQEAGDLLAVGGSASKEALYVGDEGRVQEFSVLSGRFESEIALSRVTPAFPAGGSVTALAANDAGDVFIAESTAHNTANESAPRGVYEFDPSGKLIASFDTATVTRPSPKVEGVALDAATGRVAVIDPTLSEGGGLYEPASGRLLGEFSPPGGFPKSPQLPVRDVTFNDDDELYTANQADQEVERYTPAPIALVVTGACTSPTTSGLTLAGEVNPNEVGATEAWFQYGTGEEELEGHSALQPLTTGSTFLPIGATLTGLRPNQLYYYRTAAQDEHERLPETPAVGQTASCRTLAASPAVPGSPRAFPNEGTFSSVLLEAKINPENAATVYRFEYADAAGCERLETERGEAVDLGECPNVSRTPPLESDEFAFLTVQQTLTELQPSTSYRYRLVGDNVAGESRGGEGTFSTRAAPEPSAATGPALEVTATSATLTGTVDPDGFEASYSFELGVDAGAQTQYGRVFSGPTGAGTSATEMRFTLAGLQPGTTYAYLIELRSGYGEPVSTVETFTTFGLSAALTAPPVLAQLPTPNIRFPQPSPSPCKKGYKRNKHGQCIKAKRAKPKKAKRLKRRAKRSGRRKSRR